ncbi:MULTISPECIES: ATP-binding protein [unclassified Streptomyces]|uniref:ATP-binding protein n=1 Tax=unclassified Streptomyces TaxID=2593676 RepID=UPI00136E611D|nr:MULTISPECIES: ATP-binding protein [unclassified Streptomyces]NDZ99860.1 ATP-binding protein [Streptomyces sp. SID10116]MYY86648.1 ATP-binding protein [Streptomyces sp. SID335]MYZ14357.1 ATP-binding protein [Streptomyces sp. SID337]NDZ85874.1 ATP-binding protein [Streptomyces sp. SID10115]NEB49224.1 ATP-binding protein [Streptomyces sp. SID339]
MPTLATRFALAGAEAEVPADRHKFVENVRAWGVPLDDASADAIRLVASELISNAVIHGVGPITVALFHDPGSPVIVVAALDRRAPVAGCVDSGDESGRGLTLVGHFAVRSGWDLRDQGKSVWAEVEVPMPTPAIRATVLRRFFTVRSHRRAGPMPHPLALLAA